MPRVEEEEVGEYRVERVNNGTMKITDLPSSEDEEDTLTQESANQSSPIMDKKRRRSGS